MILPRSRALSVAQSQRNQGPVSASRISSGRASSAVCSAASIGTASLELLTSRADTHNRVVTGDTRKAKQQHPPTAASAATMCSYAVCWKQGGSQHKQMFPTWELAREFKGTANRRSK